MAQWLAPLVPGLDSRVRSVCMEFSCSWWVFSLLQRSYHSTNGNKNNGHHWSPEVPRLKGKYCIGLFFFFQLWLKKKLCCKVHYQQARDTDTRYTLVEEKSVALIFNYSVGKWGRGKVPWECSWRVLKPQQGHYLQYRTWISQHGWCKPAGCYSRLSSLCCISWLKLVQNSGGVEVVLSLQHHSRLRFRTCGL